MGLFTGIRSKQGSSRNSVTARLEYFQTCLSLSFSEYARNAKKLLERVVPRAWPAFITLRDAGLSTVALVDWLDACYRIQRCAAR